MLSERKILAQYEADQMFEEASLCAAVESLRTDEFVMCPVCQRCALKLILNKHLISFSQVLIRLVFY